MPEPLTPEQIAAALREISDQSVQRFEDSVTKAKEIVELYKSRADAEENLSEVIAKNNEIARAEAQKAMTLLRENQIRRLKFADEEAAKKKDIAAAERNMLMAAERQTELLVKQRDLVTKIREEQFLREGVNEDLIKQLSEELKTTKDLHTQAGKTLRTETQRRITGKQDLKMKIERNGLDEQQFGALVRERDQRDKIATANEGIQSSTRGLLKTFLGQIKVTLSL